MDTRKIWISILIVLAVLGVLAVAFFLGGPASTQASPETSETAEFSPPENVVEPKTEEQPAVTEPAPETVEPEETAPEHPAGKPLEEKTAEHDSAEPKVTKEAATTASEEPVGAEQPAEEPREESLRDRYDKESVAAGRPEPVDSEDATITDEAHTCTISISCDTILNNLDQLRSEKADLVPDSGVILTDTAATFYEGESVFHLLQRVCKQQGIHMEFTNTPIYHSAYIEGIANLYEFDCGNLSGWMYSVNGWFPNYGCSRYALREGDVIRWVYTCDLGRDVGGYELTG